jgi:hypothetical protein
MSFFDSGRAKGPIGINNLSGSRYEVWGNPPTFRSTMRANVEGPGHATVFNREALVCPDFIRCVNEWRQATRR